MKAIKITQLLKDYNPLLFNALVIGTIYVFNDIPNSFVSPNYNAGQRTDGYHLLSNEIHKQDGFFDLITPEILENEKLGEIYFDEENQVFTYQKLDIPPPTIEEMLEKETQKYLQRSQDGQNAYAKLSAEFRLSVPKYKFWNTINGYFKSGAIDRDKFANHNYRTGLNFWLSSGGYEFGNEKETMSSAIGKKSLEKSLNWWGCFWYYFLYAIDFSNWKNGGHCIASINNNI